MDSDEVVDEIAGSLVFDKLDIIAGKIESGKFSWKDIYGSPMNLGGSKAKRAMNEDPDMATFWKGRILMQITCERTEKPLAKVEKIPEEIIMEAKAFMRDKEYDVILEVG
jgi:hypothetical protein